MQNITIKKLAIKQERVKFKFNSFVTITALDWAGSTCIFTLIHNDSKADANLWVWDFLIMLNVEKIYNPTVDRQMCEQS